MADEGSLNLYLPADHMEKVAILDFGGQYAHLVANRVRRLGVYSEIVLPDAPLSRLAEYKGIIFSGGPSSVYDPEAPHFNREIIQFKGPILGLCYGHQLLCQLLGGTVERGSVREYGAAVLEPDTGSRLFSGLGEHESIFMSHGDQVTALPEGFSAVGRTADCPYAAVQSADGTRFGLQFHPEVTHTEHGMGILRNFLTICGCAFDWDIKHFFRSIREQIQQKCAGKKVFLLVSGGVDSTVAFMLLNQVLGEGRVLGIHIDNGLMRQDESKKIEIELKKFGFHNLRVIQAQDRFLGPLREIYEPEKKRKIIGETFVRVYQQTLEELTLNPREWLLGQGTIYPDTIESGGTRHAAVIKTHHNRVGLIEELIAQGKVIEPLAELYKDEVRDLGLDIGINPDLVWRHPFPGPGLGVRALCHNGEAVKTDPAAMEKIGSLLMNTGYTGTVLPLRSVGVQGDSRTYAQPLALEGPLDYDALEKISTACTNAVAQVNRVIIRVEGGAAIGLQTKKCYLQPERLEKLREADALATAFLMETGEYLTVWQMPVVLVPLGRPGAEESIILRPVYSAEAMTAKFGRLPVEPLRDLARRIIKLGGISDVYLDVTHKPPGTIEWE
jgi:GMP synthase (glutamine-hydrolysing)